MTKQTIILVLLTGMMLSYLIYYIGIIPGLSNQAIINGDCAYGQSMAVGNMSDDKMYSVFGKCLGHAAYQGITLTPEWIIEDSGPNWRKEVEK